MTGLALAGVAVATLSGCTPQGRVWALGEEGAIQFAVCENFVASSISVRIQGVDEPAWSASGAHTFVKAERLVYGVAPDGFTNDFDPGQIDDATRVVVSIKPEQGSTESMVGVFALADLEEGSWLSAGGQSAAEPCG